MAGPEPTLMAEAGAALAPAGTYAAAAWAEFLTWSRAEQVGTILALVGLPPVLAWYLGKLLRRGPKGGGRFQPRVQRVDPTLPVTEHEVFRGVIDGSLTEERAEWVLARLPLARTASPDVERTREALRNEASAVKETKKETTARVAETQTDHLREMLMAAGRSGGLNRAQVTAILASFDQENVPQELWAERLSETKARLKDLEARLKAPSNHDSENSALLAAAGEAIQTGAFDKADGLLAEAERRDLEAGAVRMTRAARIVEQRADLAQTEGRQIEAADHYERASSIMRPIDNESWARLKFNEGLTAYEHGQFNGEGATLDRAVTAFREALTARTRERAPLDWAITQYNLGNVLQTLGNQGDDAALADAVTAYREALKEHTRERLPLDWAMTQNNLGNALQTLGARGDDVALADAVIAYREALIEITRGRSPSQWAAVQNNLGSALQTLGQRGDETALADAVSAYREALKEYRRESWPLEWAATQNNLGSALQTLGQRGNDAALADAVTAFREALKERTRARMPLQWAMTQNNLGNALETRGDQPGNRAAWEAAAACYRNALLEFTRERVPAYWQNASENLARVEAKLAA